jgi:hypothetical protein
VAGRSPGQLGGLGRGLIGLSRRRDMRWIWAVAKQVIVWSLLAWSAAVIVALALWILGGGRFVSDMGASLLIVGTVVLAAGVFDLGVPGVLATPTRPYVFGDRAPFLRQTSEASGEPLTLLGVALLVAPQLIITGLVLTG